MEYNEQAFKITRHDLDAVCASQPVILLTRDAHSVVANSLLLDQCGITRETPDPDGGTIDRDANAVPLGPLRESAAQLLLSQMPTPKIEYLMEGAAKTFARMSANGITSIGAILQTGDEGPAGSGGMFDTVFLTMLLDMLPFSCCSWLIADSVEPLNIARQSPLHQEGTHRVAGLKIFSDGTFSSRTAFMLSPFSDSPGNCGYLVHPESDIYRRMVSAHTAGYQIAIHAIGDAANRTCVNLYERLLTEYPREDHRHRLEHASLLNDDIIRDIARLGIVVSTQPLFIHSEKHFLPTCLGASRTPWVYPYSALFDAGVRVAGASDAPVESTDVLHAIECCVTRDGFETGQCLTIDEAIQMYTINAAYAQHEAHLKGSIAPGKRADLVILDRNPAKASIREIRAIQVLRTIVGGKTVFEA